MAKLVKALPMKKIDDEIILKIKDLVEQGMSSRAIAEEIGKTRDAVLAIMKRRGIKSKYFDHTNEKIICNNCRKEFECWKQLSLISEQIIS